MDNAVLLAGGLGTRLRPASGGVPKPLVEVAGRPFIEYVLDHVVDSGCRQLVIAASYKWELMKQYLGTNYRGCRIDWSIEESPLGTGGAMKQAFLTFRLNNALVLNADTYFPVDINAFERAHAQAKASITLALRQVSDVSRFGEVETDSQGRVISFGEKRRVGPGLINGGIYIIDSAIWDNYLFQKAFSFEKEVLSKILKDERIIGCRFDSYFIDIGVPEDLERARAHFANSSHKHR